jgi:hypothetical protein
MGKGFLRTPLIILSEWLLLQKISRGFQFIFGLDEHFCRQAAGQPDTR